jgi:hypothetical protein
MTVDRKAFPPYLRRPQASEYLADVWGLAYAPGTLSKMCAQGRGPTTFHAGRTALHTPEALDVFARARIKAHTGKATRIAFAATSPSTPPLSPIVPVAGEWRPQA